MGCHLVFEIVIYLWGEKAERKQRNLLCGSLCEDMQSKSRLAAQNMGLFKLMCLIAVLNLMIFCQLVDASEGRTSANTQHLRHLPRIPNEAASRFADDCNFPTESPSAAPSILCSPCLVSAAECNPNNYVCPLNFDPVCGCDGTTYSNNCTARYYGCNLCSTPGQCSLDARW